MRVYYWSISDAGFDGFQFTSVPVGEHNITITGTTQDGRTINAFLGPLVQFRFSANWISQGTFLTLATLTSTEAATFECQLDSQPFVPCKLVTLLITFTNCYAGFQGFNFTQVQAGLRTLTIRATSSSSGATATGSTTIDVPVNVVTFRNIRSEYTTNNASLPYHIYTEF